MIKIVIKKNYVMKRSLSQLFFRYLPSAMVDFNSESIRIISKVNEWDYRIEKTGTRYLPGILRDVSQRLSNFKYIADYPNRDEGLHDPDNYILLNPRLKSWYSANVFTFPLTFECKLCGTTKSYNTLFKKVKPIRCPNKKCRGYTSKTMVQLDIVGYHHCGEIKSLSVPPKCNNERCKQKLIKLNRLNSTSPYHWIWECIECYNKIIKLSIFQVCSYCKSKKCEICKNKYGMKIAPFRKREIFYPLRIYAIGTDYLADIKNINFEKEIKLYIMDGTIKSVVSETEINEFKEKIKEFNLSDEAEIEMTNKFISEKISDQTNEKLSLGSFGELANNHLVHSSISSFQELKKLKEQEDQTITETNWEILGIKKYPYSFSTEQLPLFFVTFGYIRDAFDKPEQRCYVKAFPGYDEESGKIPLITHSVKTEAIILEVSRQKILKYLFINTIINEDMYNIAISSIENEKLFFLEHCSKQEALFYKPLAKDKVNKISFHIYSVLHTISHSLIKSASTFSGFESQSLSEIIISQMPYIIIYHNQSTEFNLGGLTSLFEQNGNEWIERAKDVLHICKYDPICIEHPKGLEEIEVSACHGCVHISENSCAHLNYDLDRRKIIGFENWKGFLEIEEE